MNASCISYVYTFYNKYKYKYRNKLPVIRLRKFWNLILRPLIKYPVTLFILLLVGYTQIFAQLYRTDATSSEKRVYQSDHSDVLILKTAEPEDIYFEEEEVEEDDRLSVRKSFVEDSIFSFTHLLADFHQKNISYSCISKYFSNHTILPSAYLVLRVFRL